MRKLIPLLIAAGALLVTGCGDDSDDTTTTAGAKAAASAPASGTAEIHLKDFAFSPSSQTVKVGTKVRWINDDSAVHNVTGGDLKSGSLSQGQRYEYTADKPGTISYVCTLHSGMTATLTVTS